MKAPRFFSVPGIVLIWLVKVQPRVFAVNSRLGWYKRSGMIVTDKSNKKRKDVQQGREKIFEVKWKILMNESKTID